MTSPLPAILLIDDNEGDRTLIADALEATGFAGPVLPADSALRGLELLQRHAAASTPVMLVLLDLNLPVMHGHRLLELIGADPALAGTAVIVFTSSPRDEDRERSLRLGARRHLVKPPTWDGYLAIARMLVTECDGVATAG